MPIFNHPSHTVFIKGTYIVKNTRLNEYVFLSETTNFGDPIKIYDHRDIQKRLSEYGISDNELDFTTIDDTYASDFLDA